MCWSSVDGTIIDSLTGRSVRPGTADVLSCVWAQGCSACSGAPVGAAMRAGVPSSTASAISSSACTPNSATTGHLAATFLADPSSATFVDDRPEDLCDVWQIQSVTPSVAHDPYDNRQPGACSVAVAYRSMNGRSGRRFGTATRKGGFNLGGEAQFGGPVGYLDPPHWMAM